LEGSVDEFFEQIDIGGAAMVRSAAKNFRYVTVAVNPSWYPRIIHELRALEGSVSFVTRYHLAEEAFFATAAYDYAIAQFLRTLRPKSGA
jgi:phosphoribosylaminoimidazolecarboxamide formyltransferase/IMP cyclohydrolase